MLQQKMKKMKSFLNIKAWTHIKVEATNSNEHTVIGPLFALIPVKNHFKVRKEVTEQFAFEKEHFHHREMFKDLETTAHVSLSVNLSE